MEEKWYLRSLCTDIIIDNYTILRREEFDSGLSFYTLVIGANECQITRKIFLNTSSSGYYPIHTYIKKKRLDEDMNTIVQIEELKYENKKD